jgi:hypothetical protein
VVCGAEVFVMLAKEKLVSHSSNVVADDDVALLHLGQLFIRSRHGAGITKIVKEKLFEALDRTVPVLGDFRPLVDVSEKEALELGILRAAQFAEFGEASGRVANIVNGANASSGERGVCIFDEIGGELIEDVFQRFVENELFASAAVRLFDSAVGFAKDRNFLTKDIHVEELGFEGVIEIGRVVGNFIDAIDELRFERGKKIEKIFRELGKFGVGIVPGVLDDALANFEGEIETGEIEIMLLELLNDTQSVKIVIEAAAAGEHEFIELALAGVAERRMANVVNESESFGEIAVEAESRGGGAGDLHDFQSVRQAIAKMVGVARGKNLRLGFETTKRARVNDAVAVSRISVAIRMRRLRVAATQGLFNTHGPRSRRGERFDEPLGHDEVEPREKSGAAKIRISGRDRRGRDQLDRRS